MSQVKRCMPAVVFKNLRRRRPVQRQTAIRRVGVLLAELVVSDGIGSGSGLRTGSLLE